MLKKSLRLTSDFHYNITRKYGKKFNYPLFSIYICKPLNYKGTPRVGINTPLSFDKRAVKRNRAKRVLNEVVRLNFQKIPNDYWILLYPRPIILDKKYEEINSEFNKAISEVFVAK